MTSWMVSEPTAVSWQVGSASAGPAIKAIPAPAKPRVNVPTVTRVTRWDLSFIERPLHLNRGHTLYGHAQLLPAASTGRAGCTLAGIPSAGQACLRGVPRMLREASSFQPPATPHRYLDPSVAQQRSPAGEAAAHDGQGDQHPADGAHRLIRRRARGLLSRRQADDGTAR